MRLTFLALIFLALISACGQNIPSGIIEPAKMERVLFDIHVADGYGSMVYPQDSAKKVSAAFYKGIYKKFDTDSAQFTESLNYYLKTPLIFEKIYKNVSTRLDAQKKYMAMRDSIGLRNILIADSIKLVKKAKKDSIDLVKKLKKDSIAKKIAVDKKKSSLKKNRTLSKKKIVDKKITSLNK